MKFTKAVRSLRNTLHESFLGRLRLKGTGERINFHNAVEVFNHCLSHSNCPLDPKCSPSSNDFPGPSGIKSGSRWLRSSNIKKSALPYENLCQSPYGVTGYNGKYSCN